MPSIGCASLGSLRILRQQTTFYYVVTWYKCDQTHFLFTGARMQTTSRKICKKCKKYWNFLLYLEFHEEFMWYDWVQTCLVFGVQEFYPKKWGCCGIIVTWYKCNQTAMNGLTLPMRKCADDKSEICQKMLKFQQNGWTF